MREEYIVHCEARPETRRVFNSLRKAKSYAREIVQDHGVFITHDFHLHARHAVYFKPKNRPAYWDWSHCPKSWQKA